MTRPICVRPWLSLTMDPNGGYRPCCLISENVGVRAIPESVDELMAMFNSQEMVQLRRGFVSGNLAGTVCRHCNQGVWMKQLPAFDDNPRATANLARVKECIDQGKAEVDALPSQLWLQMSKICNLNCIMCNQKPLKPEDLLQFPVNSMINLFDSMDISIFSTVIFWGGEPLFSKDAVDLLEYFAKKAENDDYDAYIGVISNGAALDKFVGKAAKIKNFNLNISMDGVGASYEKIRRGASFDVLVKNLKAYKQATRSWRLTVMNCVLMAENFHQILDVLQFAAGIELPRNTLSFVPVHRCDVQDVILNPTLIRVPDWEAYLDAAIRYAREIGQDVAADNLGAIKADIAKRLAFLSREAIAPGSRCAIYGSGTRGDDVRVMLSRFRPDIRIAYFIDTFKETRETQDIPVVNYKDMGRFEAIDHIVIASHAKDAIEKLIKAEIKVKYTPY